MIDLGSEIVKLICNLESNLNYSQNDIQFIVKTYQNFISNVYNPFLLEQLQKSNFGLLEKDVKHDITLIFQRFNDPFLRFSTDNKRLTIFKNMKLYEEPIIHTIDTLQKHKDCNNSLQITQTKKIIVLMNLKSLLKSLFEIDGLYEATLENQQSLEEEIHLDKDVMTSFLQGELWCEQKASFHKKDGKLLPLIGYFDEIQSKNGLSGHAENNVIGGFIVTCPSFPSNFASRLIAFIVSALFYAKDLKKYGNAAMFTEIVKQLNELSENGILVNTKNGVQKIYFLTSLIAGDNKAMNELMGFTACFHGTVCCRMCYGTPKEIISLVEENLSILRTVPKYEEDILNIQPKITGIVKKTVFCNLKGFHPIVSRYVDIMHDIFEGFGSKAMARIIVYFHDTNIVPVHVLNKIIRSKDFNFEGNNIPNDIKIEYLKKNGKLKMSSSETLFIIRWYGLMVGEYVDVEDDYWVLYLLLREILHIVTSPQSTPNDRDDLKSLVTDFLILYKKLCGDLSFKFHLSTHYEGLTVRIGPLLKVSTMRFESKNREIRRMFQASQSGRNSLKTTGIRYQLSAMNLKYERYEKDFINKYSTIEDFSFLHYFKENNCENKKSLSSIEINGIVYKLKSIIIIKLGEVFPLFGEISGIYMIGNTIYFRYSAFAVGSFNKHYFAYSVFPTDKYEIIEYNNLSSPMTCLQYQIKSILYIATKHRL